MRKLGKALGVGLLVVFALSFVLAPDTEARSGGSSHNEVVQLRCTQTGSNAVGVADSSSSAGAPTFTFDTNCSQAIADLLDDGFEIHAARGDDQFLYTLIKERRSSSGK
jgi:hypothetical protein